MVVVGGPLRYDPTAFREDFQLHLDHNDQLIAPGTAAVSDVTSACVCVRGGGGFVLGSGGVCVCVRACVRLGMRACVCVKFVRNVTGP